MNLLRALLGALILILLMGFDYSLLDRGRDGYYFEKKEYYRPDVIITYKFIDNRKEYDELKAERFTSSRARKVEAWSVFYRDVESEYKECIVYVPDPSWTYRPELIGHEVLHCFFGEWHPNQK